MSTVIYTAVIIALLVLVPVIDQITKALAMSATMDGGRVVTLIPDVLRLHIVRNTGASMGLWANSAAGRVFFMVLSVVAIVGVTVVVFSAGAIIAPDMAFIDTLPLPRSNFLFPMAAILSAAVYLISWRLSVLFYGRREEK